MHRWTSRRRAAATLGVAGLMALAALGCRMVGDRVTGLDLENQSRLNARSECVIDCNEAYKACKRAEEDRSRENMATCDLLPSANSRRLCKQDEMVRHLAAHQACVDAKIACKSSCYNEGAGSGGS